MFYDPFYLCAILLDCTLPSSLIDELRYSPIHSYKTGSLTPSSILELVRDYNSAACALLVISFA
jgi:hypothetical protein